MKKFTLIMSVLLFSACHSDYVVERNDNAKKVLIKYNGKKWISTTWNACYQTPMIKFTDGDKIIFIVPVHPLEIEPIEEK